MTLTKKDITKRVRDRLEYMPKQSRYYHPYDPYAYHSLNKTQCENAIGSLLNIIKESLEKGENILISGFGKFSVKEKKERRGRNPETGNSMELEARRIVTFSCSNKLRKAINSKNDNIV